jgi:SAM-dependent methyltransferase
VWSSHGQLSQKACIAKHGQHGVRIIDAMESTNAATGLENALPASEWVRRFGRRILPGGRVLDVACGEGRHANWFAAAGYAVSAVDRQAPASLLPGVVFKLADIESGPWPFADQRFAGIVVTNYLYRPLFPRLLAAVEMGGWLIYETFAVGNEKYGRPSRPEFLLRPGELLEQVGGKLQVVAYEHDTIESPKPAVVQRIAAWRGPD